MSKLFILGNGFDLAHCLPTSYRHFQNYLYDTYPEAYHTDDGVWSISPQEQKDGGMVVDRSEAVAFITYVIDCAEGPEWSDLESTLGKLNFDSLLSDAKDMIGEIEPNRIHNNIEDLSAAYYVVMKEMRQLFKEWVEYH